MVTVYFWKPNLPQAGHLSLGLSDSITYISHWPKESKHTVFSVEAKQMPKLEDDIRAEGRSYDAKLEIDTEMIDEPSILEYWNELTSSSSKYHALNKNCAQIVLNCIQVGVKSKSRSLAALELAIKDAKQLTKLTKVHLRKVALATAATEDGPQFVLPSEIYHLLQMWIMLYNEAK